MEQVLSSLDKQVVGPTSPSSYEDEGQIRMKDSGLLTLTKLVLRAMTPFVGGLSLLN